MWLKLRNELEDHSGNGRIKVDHFSASLNPRERNIKNVFRIWVVGIFPVLQFQPRRVKGAEIHQVSFAVEKWKHIDCYSDDK